VLLHSHRATQRSAWPVQRSPLPLIAFVHGTKSVRARLAFTWGIESACAGTRRLRLRPMPAEVSRGLTAMGIWPSRQAWSSWCPEVAGGVAGYTDSVRVLRVE